MEGDPLRAGAAQGGEAVADLLETGLEASCQDVDVVALGLGGPEEPIVGHEHRAGEVVGQGHPGQGPGGAGAQQRMGGEPVQQIAVFEKGELVGQLESPAALGEQFGQAEDSAFRIEAAQIDPDLPTPYGCGR